MRKALNIALIAILIMILGACSGTPETVEVTRVVTETVIETVVQEVEVTRMVEGEVVTETIIEEVEVTRVVEVEAEAAPVDETGPRTLTIFTTEADPPQLEILNEIIDEYHEENPNVFVDVVTGTPATRGERIATLLAAGADAGIFEMEAAFANDWAEAGFLLPLDDVFEGIGGEAEYVPGSYYEKDGTVYGIPYATSVYGLWIRTDLFEEAGLEPPTNYEEVLAAAEILNNPSEGIYGIAIPGSTNASVNFFSTYLWNNCLDYYSPTGEFRFDEPEVLDAINQWVALTEFAPPGFENWSWGDQVTAFVSGQAAMSVYAGRLGVRMPEQAPQLEPISDIIRLPWSNTDDSDYVTYGSWSRFAIANNTAYPETAKDFLQFFLSGDRLARYDATVIGHMVPPTNEVGALLEGWDSDYARNHSDWLAFFNEHAAFTNHPANNMGSMQGCDFVKHDYGPPWGGAVFSRGGILDLMLQEIYIGGKDTETAWQEAIEQMVQVQEDWLAEHPDWVPPEAPQASN
ncbi:MAG: sugar ABC transporter substrate-binding protein [Chloroflexi bacterium]|nr:sugar ABC transporter substrate-binding protein [Chloroflexota bacterium]